MTPRTNRKRTTTLAALLAAGFLCSIALTAYAQPAPDRGRGGMLDEQQRELFRQAMEKEGDQLRALATKMEAAQKALMQATLAETYDEKVVQEKADAVAKIQVQMTLLRAKALSTVAPTLKAEQKEQLLESRFGAMMLTGGFGPMDRGRARGGDQGGGRGGAQRGQGRPGR